MITAAQAPEQAVPALLDKRAVAAMLGCSSRHVDRLADTGRMPPPVRIGVLVRWRRSDLDAWLSAGCPADAATLGDRS